MTKLRFQIHCKTFALAAMVAGASLSTMSTTCAAAGQPQKTVQRAILTSLWSVPKDGGAAWLVQPGITRQIRVAFSGNTIVTGTCQHCHALLSFKVSESGRPCRLCCEGSSQAACIVGKPLASATIEGLLRALPTGTGLRAIYNVPGQPESGLRSLTIDRNSVLLSVSGLQHLTPPQVSALVKPLGVRRAVLLAAGTQLSIDLKHEWTTERKAQLEKRLARVGGSLAYTTPACCSLAPG